MTDLFGVKIVSYDRLSSSYEQISNSKIENQVFSQFITYTAFKQTQFKPVNMKLFPQEIFSIL